MEKLSLSGRSILIVEDELIIALDIASAFEAAGVVVSAASNLGEAMRLVKRDKLSAAVVDFGLGGENAEALVGRLNERNATSSDSPAIQRSLYQNRPIRRSWLTPSPALASSQSHAYPMAFAPERPSEIRQAFDDRWKVIAAGFARDQGEEAASRFAKLLFDVAGVIGLAGEISRRSRSP